MPPTPLTGLTGPAHRVVIAALAAILLPLGHFATVGTAAYATIPRPNGNYSEPPLLDIRNCYHSQDSTAPQRRRSAAALRVARVAKKQSNYAGIGYRDCGGRIVLTGTGNPKKALRKAVRREERAVGLRSKWRRVPNTRAEYLRDLRTAVADPRVSFAEVDTEGRRLRIATENDQLHAMDPAQQRAELGVQVRRFFVSRSDLPASARKVASNLD